MGMCVFAHTDFLCSEHKWTVKFNSMCWFYPFHWLRNLHAAFYQGLVHWFPSNSVIICFLHTFCLYLHLLSLVIGTLRRRTDALLGFICISLTSSNGRHFFTSLLVMHLFFGFIVIFLNHFSLFAMVFFSFFFYFFYFTLSWFMRVCICIYDTCVCVCVVMCGCRFTNATACAWRL